MEENDALATLYKWHQFRYPGDEEKKRPGGYGHVSFIYNGVIQSGLVYKTSLKTFIFHVTLSADKPD